MGETLEAQHTEVTDWRRRDREGRVAETSDDQRGGRPSAVPDRERPGGVGPRAPDLLGTAPEGDDRLRQRETIRGDDATRVEVGGKGKRRDEQDRREQDPSQRSGTAAGTGPPVTASRARS